MTWLLTLIGVLLVVLALRDVFHTLWHPRGFGSLGRAVFAAVWRLTRGGRTELAGPLGLFTVALTWTTLVVAGWTLVYLPHMPEGFYFSSSLQPQESTDLVTALYLSLVTVGTLGFGDVTPATPALRMAAPLQALIGFGLVTAVITWVLQVYPALIRRRTAARQLSMMAATRSTDVVRTGDPAAVVAQLQALVDALVTARMDLLEYGETYYFRDHDDAMALAAALPYSLDLAAAGRQSESAAVRGLAAMLELAAGDLARAVAAYVGERDSVPEILDAFAADHGHRPLHE